MLETIMNSYVVFWAMGIVVAVGAISKIITAIALKQLVKAAGRMGKSTHKLMKLVKAKFEHTYMLSNGVDNTGVFVDKYLHEYKILGLRLHTWRYLEQQMLWVCGILGCIGAAVSYRQGTMHEMALRYLVLAVIGMTALFLIRTSTDEEYQFLLVQTYMRDYLENICAPRYQKQQALQLRKMEKTVEEAPIDIEPDKPEEPVKEMEEAEAKEEIKEAIAEVEEEEKAEKKVPQEVILREILEEFLA